MTDVLSKQQRSALMAKVRSKHTKPELIVRRALHAAGFRFRLHVRTLPSTPDIVLPRLRTIVQVKGCFWHGHSCLKGHLPKQNRAFWREKIERNRERDRQNERRLRSAGWRVKTVWECRVRRWGSTHLQERLSFILKDDHRARGAGSR